ncbi:hypothetical protein GGX14DRAFT_634526 [Mycena pura]|uniref:Uncharacterized protein n=1 Tax=Mycena pura TaxID=153505 RepID=A0AAD6VIA2_9AGAR|nr:hypothetical protein GGX14DRAFT_634526 [Mycena pura]
MRLPMHEYDDVGFWTTSQQEALEEMKGFGIECALETLQACLIRSKNHGLSIRLWTTESTLEILLLKLLLKDADRWEEVILLGPSEATCPSLCIEQQDLPRFRTLARSLSSLSSACMSLTGSNSPFHGRICNSTASCVALPIGYSQLKQLVMLHRLQSHMHVVFPSLRVASFHFHDLSTLAAMVPIAFETPPLEEYNVEGLNINHFSVCIPHGSSLLRKLSVHFARGAGLNPGDTKNTLECFPALTEVSLWGPNYFTDECLECLTPSIDREPLLPQILRLSSTSFVHGYCKWTMFLSLLRARFVPPTTTVLRLHTFEFLDDSHGWDENVKSGLVNLRRQRGWNIRVKAEMVNSLWTDFRLEWPA